MVEPSENLQKIFDKALDVTKKLNHEYLTLEHLLFSMLCERMLKTFLKQSATTC